MLMTPLQTLTVPISPSTLQLSDVNYDAQFHRPLHVTNDLAYNSQRCVRN